MRGKVSGYGGGPVYRKGPVVRKLLRTVEAIGVVYRISIASILFSAAGILLYLWYYSSDIVLFEAFVWMVEAIAFMGIAVALKIASSRTLFYKARYEILRVEALASSIIGMVGLIVTVFIVVRSILEENTVTPLYLSAYPITGAILSYILDLTIHGRLHFLEVKLVSLNVISNKLRYDIIVEAAGGLGIILANIFSEPAMESTVIIVIGVYVIAGLYGIVHDNMLYLIGPGPIERRLSIRDRIMRELGSRGYKVRNIRIEVYGTFSEAEVWVELDSNTPLAIAYKKALRIARILIHRIPELLRVIVITVPSREKGVKRRRGYRRPSHV